MRVIRVAAIALCSIALTTPAFAASVKANGICEVGTCNTSDVLNVGGSSGSPFSFVYTFGNSDRYQATGNIASMFPPGYNQITASNIALTYLGNSTNTASSVDVLTIDFLQYFNDSIYASGTGSSGFEYISGNFTGLYSNASGVTGQAFTSGGTAMALLGPFSPPNPFSASATNQPFTVAPTTLLNFRDTVTFGAGSGVGATINVNNVPPAVPTVPEPTTLLLVLSAGLLFMLPQRLAPARSRS